MRAGGWYVCKALLRRFVRTRLGAYHPVKPTGHRQQGNRSAPSTVCAGTAVHPVDAQMRELRLLWRGTKLAFARLSEHDHPSLESYPLLLHALAHPPYNNLLTQTLLTALLAVRAVRQACHEPSVTPPVTRAQSLQLHQIQPRTLWLAASDPASPAASAAPPALSAARRVCLADTMRKACRRTASRL